MRSMQRIFAAAAVLLLTAASANAALISRAGGRAYYDTVLDITWLADANAGAGSIHDDGVNATDGRMTWASAQAWIGSLNSESHLGANTWRLPEARPVDGNSFDYMYQADGSSDVGFNISAPGSAHPGSTANEMAHLFYNTLGNAGYLDTGGSPTGCSPGSPFCLANTGPFSNLEPYYYWSGTTHAIDVGDAWVFRFNTGYQYDDRKTHDFRAWAVSSGDVLIPVPGAVWMLGPALGLLGLVRRKLPGE